MDFLQIDTMYYLEKLLSYLFVSYLLLSIYWLAAMNDYSIFNLSENSVLYTMSTLAQVTCALLALIFISTPFLNNLLDRKKEIDDTWTTAVYEVKKRNFLFLLSALLFAFLILFTCFLTLINFEYPKLQHATFNSSIIFFIFFAIIFILSCIFNFDPKRLDKITNKLLKTEFNAHEVVKNQKPDTQIIKVPSIESFDTQNNENLLIGEFFKKFTLFENNVLQRIEASSQQNRHLPLHIAVNLLLKMGLLNKKQTYEIKEIIRFRNLLAHKAYDLELDANTLKKQINILDDLNKIFPIQGDLF